MTSEELKTQNNTVPNHHTCADAPSKILLASGPDQITIAAQALVCTMPQVMNLMELSSLKESLVGLPGHSGLSVEQRKRLTIAVELVANPSIVFLVSQRSSKTRWSYFPLPHMTGAVAS